MTKTWMLMRDTILGYYQAQGLPLHQVMKIMSEKHNFFASQRAYRQQFRKWEVFKYNRKSRPLPVAQQPRLFQTRSGTPARYSSGHRSGRMPYQEAYSPRGSAYAPNQLNLQLPLPKLDLPNQCAVAHHMPYSAAHMDQSSPSSSDSAGTSTYGSYRPLDSRHAYHDAHQSLDSKSTYPPLQTSPQPHQSVSYSQAYYNQAPPYVSSPMSENMDRYRSCNSGCCSHEQSSTGQGSQTGSVPLVHSDSRSSFPPTPPYSHHSSISASPPSPPSFHDSHVPHSPGTIQGSLASHTATLPHHSHAHMPTPYPQYTQAISVV